GRSPSAHLTATHCRTVVFPYPAGPRRNSLRSAASTWSIDTPPATGEDLSAWVVIRTYAVLSPYFVVVRLTPNSSSRSNWALTCPLYTTENSESSRCRTVARPGAFRA